MSANSDKGYRLERDTRDYLRGAGLSVVRPQHAGNHRDAGDIVGVEINGRPFLIECKNHARLDLGTWLREAVAKSQHDGGAGAVVVHKRRGVGDPGRQYATLELGDLVTLLLAATRPRP